MLENSNPFAAASTQPYALPPFADIRDEHYEPAIRAGFTEQLEEIAAITAQVEAPTVENTLVPLEQSGILLNRVAAVFFNKSSSDSTDATTELEETLAPLWAAHADAIRLDAALYARIRTLHEHLDDIADAQTRHVLAERYRAMTLAGAGLDEESKVALREYNSTLSTLTTRFEKQLLADTNELAVVVDDVAELDGLSDGEISAAASAAAERGLDGRYLIALTLYTGHPWLASLTRADVRARVMTASRARGAHGGPNDTRALVLEITRLRAERARLLGFPTHAAWVTADQTAKNPEAVHAMLSQLAPAAAENARGETSALLTLVPEGEELTAADWKFYTEIERVASYDVDTAALRVYFEAERVLQDGVFFAAERLYGVTFTERPDLVAYHPEARVFEVTEEGSSPVGLLVHDLYTRDSKRGGAWMNFLVEQGQVPGQLPVVVNNLNVPKPAAGSPVLLTFDEVGTLFHEFGHALHGLFARAHYGSASGTSVPRDFVEFPSQVNEMWMLWPEVVDNYARHVETGERLPADIIDRIRASEAFNEGFSTSEYLGAALLDQAWHRITADDTVDDVDAFEARALAEAGLDNPLVPPRYASSYFAHTFSGGYDAGYYGYIWSEVLDADTVEWFRDNGGLTRENGQRFRDLVLGVGGTTDALDAYRAFRGRDAEITPLLRRRGLLRDDNA